MEKVLVAMSGGVDSSVAAALLLEQGYQAAGATLQLHDLRAAAPGVCGSADDLEDARQVACQLGIPHYLLQRQELFRRRVMEPFVAEYCRGRTPNPCIECNCFLKFGALLDWALEQGYEIDGDLYEEDLVNYTTAADPQSYLLKLSLKIRRPGDTDPSPAQQREE